MVCELPQKVKDAIERHKECFRTTTFEGEKRERQTGGFGVRYVEECEEGRQAWMKRAGARPIADGVHRDVYGFRDGKMNECVVKVARSDDRRALEANKNEWKGWHSVNKEAKQYLMPVNDADPKGWWLTMELAEEGDCESLDPYQTNVPYKKRTAGGRTVRTPGGSSVWQSAWTTVYPEGGDCGYTLQNDLRAAGYHVDDVHEGNVGYWDGRNVLIDYGFGLEPRDRGDGPRIRPIRTPVPRVRRPRPGPFAEADVRRSRPRPVPWRTVYRTPGRGDPLQRTITRGFE